MKYSLSCIFLDLFCSSRIDPYQFKELRFKNKRGYIWFDRWDLTVSSFLEGEIGILYYKRNKKGWIVFPFVRVDSLYFNYIPFIVEDGFKYRHFDLPSLEDYIENPFMKMIDIKQNIHINTNKDSHFVLTKNKTQFCALCKKYTIILQLYDTSNENDQLQICFKCIQSLFIDID